MKRLLAFALLVLAIACQDGAFPSGSSGERSGCWAYIVLVLADGREAQLFDHFDPCPSDSALHANGWTRSPNPIWLGR